MPQIGAQKPISGAFFDTDFVTIDTFLAVGLLYGMQGRRECLVATVTMSRPNLAVASFADAVLRYYHGPAGNFSQLPPVGMTTTGAPGETSPAYVAPFRKTRPDGSPVYRNQVKSVIDTGDPLTLIRNYLQAQHDQDAFFILAGPATNLAAALDFPGVKELIATKIKRLVIAGGTFPPGTAEAHIKSDIPAARKVLAEWPTPIVMSGAEIGGSLAFPGATFNPDPAQPPVDNPVADAYRAYQPMPYDAPSWALAAALYAVRPDAGYFKLSAPGRISVDGEGRTIFAAAEKGNHRYLIADPAQTDNITQAYVQLATTRGGGRRSRGGE